MKRAKFALTAVAILAVVGGALAFKANRQSATFYTLGATTLNNQQTSACIVPTILQRVPAAVGQTTPYSSTFNNTLATTACVATVINNG